MYIRSKISPEEEGLKMLNRGFFQKRVKRALVIYYEPAENGSEMENALRIYNKVLLYFHLYE